MRHVFVLVRVDDIGSCRTSVHVDWKSSIRVLPRTPQASHARFELRIPVCTLYCSCFVTGVMPCYACNAPGRLLLAISLSIVQNGRLTVCHVVFGQSWCFSCVYASGMFDHDYRRVLMRLFTCFCLNHVHCV